MPANAKNCARLSAAAFVMGLSLAGPQFLGVAAADTGENASATADQSNAATGPSRASARGSRTPATGRTTARSTAPTVTGTGQALGTTTSRLTHPAAARAATAASESAAAKRSSDVLAVPTPPTPPRLRLASTALRTAPPSAALQGATAGTLTPTTAGDAVAAPAVVSAPAASSGNGPARAASGATGTQLDLRALLGVAVQKVETQTFNRIINNLIQFAGGGPAGTLANNVEGALLLLRRKWFNDGTKIIPSPQYTSTEGIIQGRIGAFSPAGSTLTYAVTSSPKYGTVAIGADGSYSFTPDAQFSGTDSFTVKITPQERERNILHPAATGSREVTINIGAPNVIDAPDVAVNLSNTAGRITVKRGLGQRYIGTVTLTNLTDTTPALWLDTSGKLGSISVKDLTESYQEFKAKAAENGATVNLTLAYSDANGTQNAVLLNNANLKVNGAGEYVFTGQIAADPEVKPTEVDVWDVVGKAYKPMFEAFRQTYNIGRGHSGQFKPVSVDFAGADFYAATITPLSYQQQGLYDYDSESTEAAGPSQSQAALRSTTANVVSAATQSALSSVTSAVTVGDTVYVGRADGSLEAWIGGQKTVLSDPGAWGYANPSTKTNPVSVKTLTAYNRELTDLKGNVIPSTFTGYIEGNKLTVTGLGAGSSVVLGSVIDGAGVTPGTIITKFLPQSVNQNSCSEQSNNCTGSAPTGGVNGSTGVYEVNFEQNVGSKAASPVDGKSTAPSGIAFTQTSLSGQPIPASVPAVVVGLSNGSIQMYSSSVSSKGVGTGGWTELHGFQADWGGVTSVLPYLDGFVVGLDNGYVRQWVGPTTNATTGSDANDPTTWDNNWQILYQPGTTPSPKLDASAFSTSQAVTAMMLFNDRPDICPGSSGKGACAGFLVGRADGSILKYNEGANGVGQPGWQTLVDAAQNSPVVGIVNYGKLIAGNSYLPSFAFADQNGYIGTWTWKGTAYGVSQVAEPGKWGNGNAVTAIAQLGDGFVVGLKSASVQQYQSGQWTQLQGTGWSGNTFDNPVRQIFPFISGEVTGGKQGVIVGLNNGSVQAWTGSGTNWVELHGADWNSAVTAVAPVAGRAVDIYGNAVTRDGVIVGLANGSVQQWSGTVTKSTPMGYIGDGTEPATFTGKITGRVLTVDTITAGIIKEGTYLTGGPSQGTFIHPFGWEGTTGKGGAGTYLVNKGQNWPSGGGTGQLVAGQLGRTLIVNLPAAYQAGVANGGLDPASLVGESVTGTNVATEEEGWIWKDTVPTKITAYLGNTGLPPGQYKYSVSLSSLTAAEPLTISGLPSTGQNDWIQLEGIPDNAIQAILGSTPSFDDLTCDANTWRCTQNGTLQQAVSFGKTLAGKLAVTSAQNGYINKPLMPFGTEGSVGSASDPIFSNPLLQPYPTGGTIIPIAKYFPYSPDSVNYTVGGTPSISFTGSFSSSANCGDRGNRCTVLTVHSVTTKEKSLTDITTGMLLGTDTLGTKVLSTLPSGTVIGDATGQPNQYFIRVPTGTNTIPADSTLASYISLTAAKPPTFKAGLDINPLAYGYVQVPDGFFPKFKPSQWSVGVLVATEIGPSIRITAPATLAPEDFTLGSLYTPGPLGIDSFTVSAGAKLSAKVTLNGLPTGPNGLSSASAYAYAVPGMVFTYNTQGAPSGVQTGFNYYLDASAEDFTKITGATASTTLTPYVKLLYGISVPESTPLIGGWSLFSLGGGFENPLTASLCVDANLGCAKSSDEATGATSSITLSSSGQLTFTAGLLGGITSLLTYNTTPVSIYQVKGVTVLK